MENQVIPDGSFPTIKNPNPEDPETLESGIEDLLRKEADLLIATDPDADRVGIAVRHKGRAVVLSGNQIAAIALEHICDALIKEDRLPANAAFVKTIGTTELFQAICDYYHRPCINVLTGFKYIAEKIRLWEESITGFRYVFGCEESLGYLPGTIVRDKDAILSSCLISEIALQAKLRNKTLVDKLDELYLKHGIYQEKSISLLFEEYREGKEKIKLYMEHLRNRKIDRLAGIPVSIREDYQSSTRLNIKTGQEEKIELPKSNVLLFWLEEGSKVIVRPSGTEPKIKLSCGVAEKNFEDISQGIEICLKRCERILEAIQLALLPYLKK